MIPVPRTLAELARFGAESFPDHTAVQNAAGGLEGKLSFEELWQRARGGAAVLLAAGLPPGARVLLALPGGPGWATAFFAIEEAGLVAVPVAPGTSPAATAAIAAHADARVCVLRGKDDSLGASFTESARITVGDLARGTPAKLASDDPERTALLCFTSGSTAVPRAVELSHRNLLSNVDALLSLGRAGPGDAVLSLLPLSHLFELVCGFLAPLACGARIVYLGAPLPNRVVECLRGKRITHALAVPALLDAIYREVLEELVETSAVDVARREQPLAETARLLGTVLTPEETARLRAAVRDRIGPHVRTLLVGGAAMDPAWSVVIGALGIQLQVGYGLTEAGPIVSGGLASASPTGSVGRPLPGVEVRCAADGEILVRGPSVMRGYVKDPGATDSALADGWLHTGDSGRLDADGFLFVTGRLKEVLVTSSGETLYPEEVEPYYDSPLFAEHCVVPLRGPDGNDVPALVVVPASPGIGEEEIRRAVASLRAAAPSRCRVAGFIRRDDPLPRTSLGKTQRRLLARSLRALETAL